MTDNVNHPSHYQANGLEAIDVLEAFFPDDPLGWQVGKYILRYKKKNGLEDLQKAQVYLGRLIEKLTPADLTPTGARVWQSMDDIPAEALTVTDKDGDLLFFSEEGHGRYFNTNVRFWPRDEIADSPTQYAPFTEVLS